MILELHRQGVSVSAIARQVGLDRKTVRKYIEHGLEPPMHGPRPPRASKIAPFSRYLRERLAAFPQLTGRRLHRELREQLPTGHPSWPTSRAHIASTQVLRLPGEVGHGRSIVRGYSHRYKSR